MTTRFWVPTIIALALLLSACGDSDDGVETESNGTSATEQEASQDDAPVQTQDDDPQASEVASPAPESEPDTETTTTAETETVANTATAAAGEEMTASSEDSISMDEDGAGAEDETLGQEPLDVLEEGGAMPGEATRSDVDEMIAETERRFEEAQRELDAQFEEAEREATTLESLDIPDDIGERWDSDADLPESIGTTSSAIEDENLDVDALIEDTERRFEEAQQRLDAQYDELEAQRDSLRQDMGRESEERPGDEPEDYREEFDTQSDGEENVEGENGEAAQPGTR